MAARLRTLEGMGLASQVNDTSWTVSSNFVDVLKAVQMAGDRQKTLARQMALASDMNMPFGSRRLAKTHHARRSGDRPRGGGSQRQTFHVDRRHRREAALPYALPRNRTTT